MQQIAVGGQLLPAQTISGGIPVPISNDEAAAIAEGIGRARGLRPGQLPDGAQFAEALNGMEECAGFIARVGQPNAPFPLTKYVPLPVVESAGGHHG
jgi:hypothetical protein